MVHDLGKTTLPDNSRGSLLGLALLSLVAGALAGLVCAIFRLTLAEADAVRNTFIAWAHGRAALGFAFVLTGCAAASAVAAGLVGRYSPQAHGSGIPHVEAVLRGEVSPAPFLLVPVKFLGGLLAIGAGLALGREGPSVQMAASLAHLVERLFRRPWPECRELIAAGLALVSPLRSTLPSREPFSF